MNFNKYISKFLAKSLLVSMGVSCFSCSVSYMMEVNDKKFLKNKRRKQSSKSSAFFNDAITVRLAHALSLRKDNKYLKELKKLKAKSENKKEYAQIVSDLSMLNIARLIYELEKLHSENLLDTFTEVSEFLDIVENIKNDAVLSCKISDDQLINFNKVFSKILDKIKFTNDNYKKILFGIRKSLIYINDVKCGYIDDSRRSYVKASLLEMFKTLAYYYEIEISNHELLYKDVDNYKKDISSNT